VGEVRWRETKFKLVFDVPEVTEILNDIRTATSLSAEDLLPQVYDELKRIAAQKMASEAAGHTLQATALVHEAWISLAGSSGPEFENRAHFFAAAAEAMRRILVDSARRKRSLKRGAGARREEIQESHWVQEVRPDELLAVDEALDLLGKEDPLSANLVKLRYFMGLSMDEAASALGLPLRTAERMWTFARAWLRRTISDKTT
jgi:RNA polymerase sigma factor (TIGR02999 family)